MAVDCLQVNKVLCFTSRTGVQVLNTELGSFVVRFGARVLVSFEGVRFTE
jgi:hypothetical protein